MLNEITLKLTTLCNVHSQNTAFLRQKLSVIQFGAQRFQSSSKNKKLLI